MSYLWDPRGERRPGGRNRLMDVLLFPTWLWVAFRLFSLRPRSFRLFLPPGLASAALAVGSRVLEAPRPCSPFTSLRLSTWKLFAVLRAGSIEPFHPEPLRPT